MERVCFVISPIGKDGSDIRTEADEFLELLIEPALEIYDFDVVRVDKIPRPSIITADVIRYVQEADLCIIDISDSNPNVFYECGRRHETGRPFVQMVRAGKTESIPFDVAGIRTVEYDLSTPRKARESVKILQDYVNAIAATGFGDRAAGHTMSSLGEALERMERKINRLSQPNSSPKRAPASIEMLTAHPIGAFQDLLKAGELGAALGIIDRVRVASGYGEYLAGLRVLSSAGLQGAYERILEERNRLIEDPAENSDYIVMIAFAIKDYNRNLGQHSEGVSELVRLYDGVSSHENAPQKLIARIANAIGMASWDASDHETSQRYEQIAVSMAPNEPSYRYNQSLTFRAIGKEEEMVKNLEVLATMDGLDEDHLELLAEYNISVAGSPAPTDRDSTPVKGLKQGNPI